MDSKPAVPLATAPAMSFQGSSSSGSSSPYLIRAPPSYDSDDETVAKTNDLKVNGKSSGSGGSSSSSSSSSNTSVSSCGSEGGFVSGEEDFETASERPFVGDPDEETLEKAMEEEDFDAPFVGSSDSPRPIAKISADDDDDEVVESPKGGEVGEDGDVVGNESSVEELGSGSVVSGFGDVQLSVKHLETGDVGKEEQGVLGETASVENAHLSEGVEVGVTEDALVEGLGDAAIENPKLNEDVSSEVEGIFVPQKVVEGTISKDEAAGEEQKYSVLDGNDSATVSPNAEGKSDLETKHPEDINDTVEGSGVFENGADQDSFVVAEPADNNFVEADGVSSPAGGDSVANTMSLGRVAGDAEENMNSEVKGMEIPVDGSVHLDNGCGQIVGTDPDSITGGDFIVDVMHADLLSSGAVGVGHVEEVNDSEVNVMEAPVDGSGPLDNGCVENSIDADLESVEVDDDNEKISEPSTKCDGEPRAPDTFQEKTNDAAITKDESFDIGAVTVTVVKEKEQDLNDHSFVSENCDEVEDGAFSYLESHVSAEPSSIGNQGVAPEPDDKAHHNPDEGETEGSITDEETEGMVFGSSEAAKKLLEELGQGAGSGSQLSAESSQDHSQRIDGQIVTDSDEEVDTDEEGDGKELFDSNALAALLKAATGAGSDGGSVTITSQDGSRLFSLERPAGLGSSLRSLRPAPRQNRPSIFTSNLTGGGELETNLGEEEKKKLEKLQEIRVKFLRLVHRLGYSPEDSIAQQVLYRLALAGGRQSNQSFSVDAAKRTALQLEEEEKDNLNFSLNILVLGKTGVGKSATINSIFGEERVLIDAFEPATTAVKEIVGTVDGVKIRLFDTPGLKSSVMEQGFNHKVLSSVKKFTKRFPPDIVLYVDRLDAQTRDLNDLPLLRSINTSLGSSIWRSVVVTLTHAASAPPDGPSGTPLSYEVFVTQRSHVIHQSIGQAVGDVRLMAASSMNPVTLVENHPSCRKNRDGQKVLPNGQSWKPQLLLLCFSMKILAEVSSLSKAQDQFDHRKLFGFRVRSPPLPYLLSWLLQSRSHPKLSTDQGGENGDSDIDLDDLSDSDKEDEEDEYEQLPPFKPLRKSQIAKLSKEQRKAYFEEYDYRVRLLQKKQWNEELKRMREIKKKGKVGADDYDYMGEDIDQENGSPAAVPVPMPDMVLPASFDADNPAYRYRFLEPTSQFLARPVLDTHGWDHDCGYDGVNLEQSLAIVGRFPAVVAIQLTKDKKEFNIHLDSSVSAKHGENGSSMAGFDIQNIGKQLAYIVRGETKFKSWKKNKTAAGFSVTFLGENVATGVKIEDQIGLGKRLVLVGSTGTVRSQGDAAYGANLEVRLREPDYPIGQNQSTLGLSLVKWRGDLALGANLQSQFSIGRSSKVAARVALNNKLSGQITVRTSSSEQLQIALVGILPIAMAFYKNFWPGASENYSIY